MLDEPILLTLPIVPDVDQHPDPVVQPPPDRGAGELLDRVQRLAVAADQQRHVILRPLDDVDVDVSSVGHGLRDGVDPHPLQELLDEVRHGVRLLLELGTLRVRGLGPRWSGVGSPWS